MALSRRIYARCFFIVAVLTSTAGILRGQSNQAWALVEITDPISDRWSLHGSISWRQEVPEVYWKRVLAQVNATYSSNFLDVVGGLSTYMTYDRKEGNLFEVRTWQGVSRAFPEWKRGEFVHLLRFEERFQLENSRWSVSPRIRYQIATRIALSKNELTGNTLYFYAAHEWLNNFNKPLAERFSNTRASAAGLGYRFSERSSLEAVYEIDVTDNLRDELFDVDVRILRLRWLITV